MSLKRILFIAFCSSSYNVFAQDQAIDTTKVTELNGVVVTGQFEPQSIRKSVHRVTIITREQMQLQAANHLGDVLNQHLNITVIPNSREGRSTISLFGLDGQYFKVMMDNIPLVSDTGLGNNVDLTQINLDDVEQIEIIEGSMGVTHGANAVSGIINIITKKSIKTNWEVTAAVQEETVGREYALFDQGRHIQSLKVSHRINEKWFASIGTNRNDFRGFQGNRAGVSHTQNDGQRGLLWLPKEQWVTNTMLAYRNNGFRAFYKFEFFDENISYYNPVVNQEFDPQQGIRRFSNDRRFMTQKWYHHFNINGTWKETNYNISLSHQKQTRDFENYKYFILSGQETNHIGETFQSTEILYSTGAWNNLLKSHWFALQLGYELVNENGFASASSGMFRDPDNQAVDLRRHLENYDTFVSSEIKTSETFSIRPGLRYSFQSQFEDQYAVSLGIRKIFEKDWEFRTSLGRSYRTPNFEELYTYFVDSNHYLVGNEELVPEKSYSLDLNLKKPFQFESGWQTQHSLTATFLDVTDRISVALMRTTPRWEYEYINIDSYQMINLATTHQFVYKQFNARIGLSLLGISQQINTGEIESSNDFLYTLQANSSISYIVPRWNTTLSVFYKFNGKQQQYIASRTENNEAQFVLSEIESFGWLDASIRKTFLKNRVEVTAGARNLLNVVDVQTGQSGSNAGHGTVNSNLLLGYGRSYFIRLTYNLNF